jgi:hypothetical protein
MKTKLITAMAIASIISAFASTSYAQGNSNDVYWRIDPNVKDCSMVIDPSLTQAQWKTFVQQVGPLASFKSLASAEPLGTMNFNVGIDFGRTPVDQRNPAWINTFTHPDADCPLGDAIAFPTIRARMGVSDKMDIGAYWITSPEANYGMVGGEVKYQVSKESETLPATAVRGSVTFLTGVSDFDVNVYGIDLLASKKIAVFTPYVGFRGSLAVGIETTPKVNLDKESLFFAQGYAGVSCSIWKFSLAAEYNVSHVNTFALAVGVNF